jgi:enediyne biosynthesis protein E4
LTPVRTSLVTLAGSLLLAVSIAAQSPKPAAPQPAASPIATAASPLVPARLVDITDKSGVHFQHQALHTTRKYLLETMGSGLALFDCDNDGRLDLFLVNGAPYSDPTPTGFVPQKSGPQDWNRMYRQKSDGTFEDITEKSGLKGAGYGMGAAVADYDNDGNEDLFVTGYGSNRLYHNNGNCTFTDVTDKAGVAGSGWSSSAAWIDLDNDGLLDLVVERYVTWDWNDVWCGEHREGYRGICHPDVFPPIAMLVYHNDGNGHFTEVAHKLGLDKPAKALGIGVADYDRDGRSDIFVANDSMPEFLFHQKADGAFDEVGLESETAVNAEGQTFAGMGIDFADYDNDGWPDIVVTDLANQRYALYHNNRDGTFDYASLTSGLGAISQLHSGWGARFVDYDNDGWKDLLVAQGHDMDNIELVSPQFRYRESVMLLRNVAGKFVDVSGVSGDIFKDAWVGRGLAVGDLDNDGRVDAVVTTNAGPAYILRNETATANHWLTLRLVGHKSNRDGIGAVVKLTAGQSSQWVTATAAGSYLSSSDLRIHFGLGNNPRAASIEIHWPSGITQTLSDVKADQQLQVDEPAETPPAAPR